MPAVRRQLLSPDGIDHVCRFGEPRAVSYAWLTKFRMARRNDLVTAILGTDFDDGRSQAVAGCCCDQKQTRKGTTDVLAEHPTLKDGRLGPLSGNSSRRQIRKPPVAGGWSDRVGATLGASLEAYELLIY